VKVVNLHLVTLAFSGGEAATTAAATALNSLREPPPVGWLAAGDTR
jgi:hypothetical protein